MTDGQFLDAVALGQITPGPVVQTVAVVGYAAAGLGGGCGGGHGVAPSFVFVLVGTAAFDALRSERAVRAFMGGAGPAAIGAIAGAAVPLAWARSPVADRAAAGPRRGCWRPARRRQRPWSGPAALGIRGRPGRPPRLRLNLTAWPPAPALGGQGTA